MIIVKAKPVSADLGMLGFAPNISKLLVTVFTMPQSIINTV